MSSSTRRLSRWVRTLRPIPSERCMSSKRRTPRKASRRTSGVHQSPSRSTLRAIEHGQSANSVRFMLYRLTVALVNATQVRVSSVVQLTAPVLRRKTPVRFADRPTTETDVYVAAPPTAGLAAGDGDHDAVPFRDGAPAGDLGRPRRRRLPRRPLHRPQLPPRPGRVGDDEHDRRLRARAPLRLGRRRSRRTVGRMAVGAGAGGHGHPAAVLGPDGPRPVRHHGPHREDARQGGEGHRPPARGVGDEHGGHHQRHQGDGGGRA